VAVEILSIGFSFYSKSSCFGVSPAEFAGLASEIVKLNSISLLPGLQAQSFANLIAIGVPACAAIEQHVTN
jgi:hypothetical protein